jgi:hypothetical protein
MAGKKLWLSWLPAEGGVPPNETIAALTQAGLEVGGAPWIDDLDKLAWSELGGLLMGATGPDLWLVGGTSSDFAGNTTRYGLSMIGAMIRDTPKRVAVACLGLDGGLAAADMPSLLQHAHILDAGDPAWPARVADAAPMTAAGDDFYLSVIAQPMIGQWVEIGPRDGDWSGAMIGTSDGGTITHHAVGPRGQLPERTTVEYPLQGLEAELGGEKFVAWAVQNRIGPAESYFVRIEGQPAKMILGQHPDSDQADVHVLDLI